jgi:hypothetical protein
MVVKWESTWENSPMTYNDAQFEEILLLNSFTPQELEKLSDRERIYLATMGVDEDLPPAEEEENFSPDQWKEQFIRFRESVCYLEAKKELSQEEDR